MNMYTGMGIGREFTEFRENVLHSPRGNILTREKNFPGSFFSQGVKLIFRRSEATYLPQHRFRFLLCACAVAPLPLWLQAQSVNMSSMSRIVQRSESFDGPPTRALPLDPTVASAAPGPRPHFRFFYFFQFPCLMYSAVRIPLVLNCYIN